MTDEERELWERQPESKIAATHRLRKEGKWDEASLYRDAQRLRLRDAGRNRRDAREESWRLMLEKYAPPDDFGCTFYSFMSEHPPRTLPLNLQPEIIHVWRVYCVMKSWLCYMQPGLFAADDAIVGAGGRLRAGNLERRDDLPGEATRPLHEWAMFADPLGFLDLAQRTFQQALDGLEGEGDEPGTEAARQELRAYVSSIPAVKQAVRDHWPSEEERRKIGSQVNLGVVPPRPAAFVDGVASHAHARGTKRPGAV